MWTSPGKFVALLVVAILCLSNSGWTIAQCVDYSQYLHWVGQVEMPDEAGQIAIQGNFAYVANFSAGLKVVDLVNPDAPLIMGGCDTPEAANQILIQNQYAYLRTGRSGLQVVDISIPGDPEIVGSLFSADNIHRIVVQGDFTYATNTNSGIIVIDVSAPDNPEIVASTDIPVNLGLSRELAIQGNFAFVLEPFTGLYTVNITNPLEPEVVGFYDIANYVPVNFGVHEGFAYVLCLDNNLIVLDVTNPAALEIVGQYPLAFSWDPSHPKYFVFSGEFAFIGDSVLDLSLPASPVFLGSIPPAFGAVAIWEEFVAKGSSDVLKLMDISSFHPVDHLSLTHVEATTTRIAVQGDFAYLTNNSMKVFDISQSDTSMIVGEINLPNGANRIAVQNNYAYVTSTDTINGSLQIIEIANPEEPWLQAEIDIVGRSNLVEVQGDNAYVTGNSNFMVVNVASPEDGYVSGSIDTCNDIYDIFVQGSFIYVANGAGGLQVIEASSPENPEIVGEITFPGEARAVAVQDGLAFVIDWSEETSFYLRVIDVSQPSSPVIVGSVEIGIRNPNVELFEFGLFNFCISVQGNYAYVGGASGLLVLDITNPHMPALLGNTPSRSGTGGLAIADSGICMTNFFIRWLSGPHILAIPFEIFPLHCDQAHLVSVPPIEPEFPVVATHLSVPYPNPFNPRTTITFDIMAAGQVNLSVFDLAGRRVTVLADEWLNAGRHEENWHGVDAFGRTVSTGQYFLRLETEQGVEIQKVILVK